MKRICFIAQFPPPVHGLSVAVQSLYDSLSEEYRLEKIDLTGNTRFFHNLAAIRKSKSDLFYVTPSQSRLGNIRDCLILLALKDRPFLVHLHGGYWRECIEKTGVLQQKWNKKLFSRASAAIVLSPRLKENFRGILPEEKIFVVPNGVQEALVSVDVRQKYDDFGTRVCCVLFLSNFIREKGYETVLDLAAIERERRQRGEKARFSFHFAGQFFSAREKKSFLKRLKGEGLEQIAVFHGGVFGEEKEQLFRSCDVLLLPTRYQKEGQPLVLLEAMSYGLTVCATAWRGIPDIVREGENGFLIRDDTPREIFVRLSALTKEDLIRFGENNVAGRERYRIEAHLTRMRDIIEGVLGGREEEKIK